MLTDCILWKGCSYEDFHNFMRETSHSFNEDDIWEKYHQLKSIHSHLELHFIANEYSFVLENEDKESVDEFSKCSLKNNILLLFKCYSVYSVKFHSVLLVYCMLSIVLLIHL